MRFAMMTATGLLLAGCATTGETPGSEPTPIAPSGDCDAAPAQGLLGQKASSELGARTLELTGATTLRWGPPGAVFTMDMRPDRVNVHYDQDMIVTKIRCG